LEPLPDLGLWGDLDELDAVLKGFHAIGLQPPFEDAPKWVTVGDLWGSVRRIAPETASSAEAWDKFREGLSKDTGVDWTLVSHETKLLDGRGAHPFTRLATTVREWIGQRRG
jgi:hypothetical protein